jgi:hypothetical protein
VSDVTIRVDIDDWKRIKESLDVRKGLRETLTQIGRHAENASKLAAPVDYGRLRAGITHQVTEDRYSIDVQVGVIGGVREMPYAWYMEYGTGTQHDHPNWPRRPHVVHPKYLSAWGPVRRGMVSAGAAAHGITKRGGLKPRRYLRGPLERNGDQYVRIIRSFIGSLRID